MSILICRLVNLLSNKLSRHSKAGFLTSHKRPIHCAIDRLDVAIWSHGYWTLDIHDGIMVAPLTQALR